VQQRRLAAKKGLDIPLSGPLDFFRSQRPCEVVTSSRTSARSGFLVYATLIESNKRSKGGGLQPNRTLETTPCHFFLQLG